MTILELPQGYFDRLDGTTRADAVAAFAAFNADMDAKFPGRSSRQFWREFDAPETATAPWGHEWWLVDEFGRLRLHSADYDSSG
jgi:hypothetical protein